MPTPFYHLSIAQALLAEPRLPKTLRAFLQENAGLFYFGNTAPDVQSLIDMPRRETHFFDVPPQPGPTPWEEMFSQYPALAKSAALPPKQAAFMAGYICHLQADILWMNAIFLPTFGLAATWGRLRERLFYHNILRTYLDYQVLPTLPTAIGQIMDAIQPDKWLPFVADADLSAWQTMLTRQLYPGAQIETVAVFAERQGISEEAYNAIVQSEEEMEEKIFTRISRQELIEYREALISTNILLLNDYLRGI